MSQQPATYQTAQSNSTETIKTLNLTTEYPLISPDEVRDLLDSLMVIRNSTGWGRIEIILLASEIDVTNILVTKKRLNKSTTNKKEKV